MDNGQGNGQGNGQNRKPGERLRDSNLWSSDIWNDADREFIDTYPETINRHAAEKGNPFLAIGLFGHTILQVANQLSRIPKYRIEAAALENTGNTLISIAISGGEKYCSHKEQEH